MTIIAVVGLATFAMWSPDGSTMPLLSVGVTSTADHNETSQASLFTASAALDRVAGAVTSLQVTAAELPNAARPGDHAVDSRASVPAQSETLDRAKGDADDESIRWFNGRPVRPVKTMTMVVTAYSPDARSCGKQADGITASGYSVWTNGMNLVAADTNVLPFGSLITVPGYDNGDVVPVLDRGGAIKGNRLDVLYATHERALQWGVQQLEVTVWEYADGKPNDFRTQHHRR